jgi:hypothetical protein
MDLKEIRWEVWIGFTWLRIGANEQALVNTVMNLQVL